MKNNNPKTKIQIKFDRIFEYVDCTQIWKYDNFKSISGPYEVENRPKKPEKVGKNTIKKS